MTSNAVLDAILVILVLTFIGYLIFGRAPDRTNIGAGVWETQSQLPSSSTSQNETISTNPKDLLKISNLEPRQKIYHKGDTPYVDFDIDNPQNVPYNFSVYWIYSNNSKFGWYNESNITTRGFSSWYNSINDLGNWQVQVILRWNYNNLPYSKDDLTTFSVTS